MLYNHLHILSPSSNVQVQFVSKGKATTFPLLNPNYFSPIQQRGLWEVKPRSTKHKGSKGHISNSTLNIYCTMTLLSKILYISSYIRFLLYWIYLCPQQEIEVHGVTWVLILTNGHKDSQMYFVFWLSPQKHFSMKDRSDSIEPCYVTI